MTAGLVDSHCHIAHVSGDAIAVVAAAREAGVTTIIDIGMGTAESAQAVKHATEIEGVFACVGLHPNDLSEFEADPKRSMATLRDLASSDRVVGIGETGLDFYRDRVAPSVQEEAFRAHIALARQIDRTLVIHCRDAHERVFEVLDEGGPPDRVVMHCFSGDVDYARRCAEHGYFCSFAGNVSYKRSDVLREAARAVPSDLLLIETDAPYLAPDPFRGKPNSPRLLAHTAGALAKARGEDVDELSQTTRDNSYRAFNVGAG